MELQLRPDGWAGPCPGGACSHRRYLPGGARCLGPASTTGPARWGRASRELTAWKRGDRVRAALAPLPRSLARLSPPASPGPAPLPLGPLLWGRRAPPHPAPLEIAAQGGHGGLPWGSLSARISGAGPAFPGPPSWVQTGPGLLQCLGVQPGPGAPSWCGTELRSGGKGIVPLGGDRAWDAWQGAGSNARLGPWADTASRCSCPKGAWGACIREMRAPNRMPLSLAQTLRRLDRPPLGSLAPCTWARVSTTAHGSSRAAASSTACPMWHHCLKSARPLEHHQRIW